LKDLKRIPPVHQITMLKFIKNLSMLTATLETLQNANAIEVLTDLLQQSINGSHFREISNQILNTMYNLCKLSKSRQEEAASMGIIPILQRIVGTERPLKEFALPILCDMAHCSKISRKILWQNQGLKFYIGLLSDPYWQVTALDAIHVWLQEETGRVEERLLNESFPAALVKCFTTSKANAFENLLEPLQKLLRLSLPIASAVSCQDLFQRILQKLTHNKAFVRLNLLKILVTICDATGRKEIIMRDYNLHSMIHKLADRDQAVLVRNLAGELLKSPEQRSLSSTSRQVARRTQSLSSAGPVAGMRGSHTSQHMVERVRDSPPATHRGERDVQVSQTHRAQRSSRMSNVGDRASSATTGRRGTRGSSALRTPSQPGLPLSRKG